MKSLKGKALDGFQVRNKFDWVFAGASFVVFLCLEGALLYVYFTVLKDLGL